MHADSLPMAPAMAHLRALRRAAHWPVGPAVVADAVDQLTKPLAALSATYRRLHRAVEHYDAGTGSWEDVVLALRALDIALGALHGPSGWEQPSTP